MSLIFSVIIVQTFYEFLEGEAIGDERPNYEVVKFFWSCNAFLMVDSQTTTRAVVSGKGACRSRFLATKKNPFHLHNSLFTDLNHLPFDRLALIPPLESLSKRRFCQHGRQPEVTCVVIDGE